MRSPPMRSPSPSGRQNAAAFSQYTGRNRLASPGYRGRSRPTSAGARPRSPTRGTSAGRMRYSPPVRHSPGARPRSPTRGTSRLPVRVYLHYLIRLTRRAVVVPLTFLTLCLVVFHSKFRGGYTLKTMLDSPEGGIHSRPCSIVPRGVYTQDHAR
jgi:hypothetical protein